MHTYDILVTLRGAPLAGILNSLHRRFTALGAVRKLTHAQSNDPAVTIVEFTIDAPDRRGDALQTKFQTATEEIIKSSLDFSGYFRIEVRD